MSILDVDEMMEVTDDNAEKVVALIDHESNGHAAAKHVPGKLMLAVACGEDAIIVACPLPTFLAKVLRILLDLSLRSEEIENADKWTGGWN